MQIDLDELVVSCPADVRLAAERLRDAIHRLAPFRIALCHNIALRQPMVDADGNNIAVDVFGWSQSDPWLQRPKLALESPLPAAARYESEPFWANGGGIYTRTPNALLASINLTRFEHRSHTSAAIVVPVHLPFGQIAAAGFSYADPEIRDLSREFASFADQLGLMFRTFINGYVHHMSTPERLPVGNVVLSKREIQCLRWAAIGKTDPEIATIMACSAATIRFHLRNARSKLDAVNRSQTVFKAGQLGYIGLNS